MKLTGLNMLSRLPIPLHPVCQETPMSAVSLSPAMQACMTDPVPLRHDWSRAEVEALFALPLPLLLQRAGETHRAHFDPTEVQVSTLLSVKTGGCPEDCAYCPQAQRYHTGVEATKLMSTEAVLEKAKQAKAAGASRFCMGAAWRSPKDRDIPKVAEMIREVKALGLETCATLGMLSGNQAQALKTAGLDYYNHNLDTAPEFYGEVIQTREFQDRLDTLAHVRDAGMKTCCGGIVGMGESRSQRAGLLQTLANLPAHPDSVPINRLVQVEGTPLNGTALLDSFEFVRTIAVARILMPKSMVRLSAGRESMNDELQALCFLAGANSIFYGEKLLTTGNPDTERDLALFERLGLRPMAVVENTDTVHADIIETETLDAPSAHDPNGHVHHEQTSNEHIFNLRDPDIIDRPDIAAA
jgi:biotin synthase